MFSENIKKLRESQNLSQSQLADIVGTSRQCVSNWENGYAPPSLDSLTKICDYFNVSMDYLLGYEKLETVDVSGLTIEEIGHISMIVNDLKNKKK